MRWSETLPPRGTSEREHWNNGARAESEAAYWGMTDEGREVFEFIRTLAQQGGSASEILSTSTYVFESKMTFRERLRLARRILTGRY